MRRRLMLRDASGGGGGLPSEYQKVEWICGEANGNTFIDTGVVFKNKPKVVTDYQIVETGVREPDVIGMATAEAPFYSINFNLGNATRIYYRYGPTQHITITDSANPHTKFYHAEFGQNVVIDGVVLANMQDYSFASNTQPLYLFKGRFQSVGVRFKTTEIYDGSEMVRNLVPCYRKSDGEIGMYDMVTKAFFTNAGTGMFTKGADI